MGTIEIKPIERHQIAHAKRVILSVGRKLYQWEKPLEELVKQFDERGELSDIDNYQVYYFDQHGLFLVVMDDNVVVGTGAVCRIDGCICELKRLWLLEKYQGKEIGYRLLQELIDFARKKGYTRMRLETDYEQERALRFYLRAGFHFIEHYNNRNSDVYMEMII